MSTTHETLPTLTDATFAAELTATSGLVAVECSADWCPPCHMMAPIVEAVAREYVAHLRVVQMDADASPATMARFGVRALPTMLVFRDGALIDRIVGAVSAAALRERLGRLTGA